MQQLPYFAFVLVFVLGCQSNTSETKNRQIIYARIDVPCSWATETVIDTTYQDGITLNLISRCRKDVTYIDTVEEGKDTFLIRSWKDIEFVIKSNQFHDPIIITKENYSDSLANDLKGNGFMGAPFQIDYNGHDTSFVLKNFIGHADSDVGDDYILKVFSSGKTQVLAVETPVEIID